MPSPCLIRTVSLVTSRRIGTEHQAGTLTAACYAVTHPLPLCLLGDEASLCMAVSEHILSTMMILEEEKWPALGALAVLANVQFQVPL